MGTSILTIDLHASYKYLLSHSKNLTQCPVRFLALKWVSTEREIGGALRYFSCLGRVHIQRF